MTILKEQALAYLARGVSIIPVGKNKRPLIEWKQYQNRQATKEEVEQWFDKNPDAQIGLVTGKISNMVVVDVEEGGETDYLPQDTTIIQTGGGGFHYYYQYYKISNKARIKPLTDIRGDGGYVIVPPSVSDKGPYTVVSDKPYPKFPAHFFEDGAKEPISKPTTLNESFNLLDYAGYGSGQRNHRMAEYIGRVLTKVSPDVWDEVAWKLVKAANAKNQPPLPEHELRGTFLSIARTEVRQLDTQEAKRFHNRDQAQTKTEFKVTSTKDLLTMELPKFPYMVDRIIPAGAITAITADSGKGKSVFAWLVAYHIATGKKLFDQFDTTQSPVMVIDQEMDTDLIAERYRSFNFGEVPIHFVMAQTWKVTNDNDMTWTIDYCKTNNIKVIILDTLSTIHDKEENSATEMRLVTQKLLDLTRAGLTVVYLHHHRKSLPGVALSQSSHRGSTETISKAASHLVLDQADTEFIYDKESMDDGAKRTKRVYTISQEKARRPESIDKMKFHTIHDEMTKVTTWEYEGEATSATENIRACGDEILKTLTARFEIKEWFMTTKEILDSMKNCMPNMSESTVRRSLAELVKGGKVEKNKDENNRNSFTYSLANQSEVNM